MKKRLAIMMGVMILVLAACAGNNQPEEASGEEGQTDEETSNEQEPEVDMQALIDQIEMDANVETTEDTAKFDFSMKNTGKETVILGFTSSQKYEIKVTNAEGENVYTFSADKMFTQELTTEEIPAGKTFSATETWTGIKQPGEYEATITFLVNSINDQPLEAKPFEVTQSFTIDEQQSNDKNREKESYGKGEAFRNVKVTGENGSYVVKGEARVFEGSFMYSVEDGHHVLIEPTSVQVSEGAPSWSEFEIKLDIAEKKLPDFGTLTLTLFEESAKDGKPQHMNSIPLENFK